jgi:hypothetical protein
MKLSVPATSIRSCLLPLAAALILPVPASYADTVLSANLTGALEIPSSGSPATGNAVVTLEPGDMMSVVVVCSAGGTAAENGLNFRRRNSHKSFAAARDCRTSRDL